MFRRLLTVSTRRVWDWARSICRARPNTRRLRPARNAARSPTSIWAWVLGNFATGGRSARRGERRPRVGRVRAAARLLLAAASTRSPRRFRQGFRHRVRGRHRACLRQQDRRADQLADLRVADPELAQLRQPDGRERCAREARQHDLRRHGPGVGTAWVPRRSDAALTLRHGGGNVLPRRQAEGRDRRAHARSAPDRPRRHPQGARARLLAGRQADGRLHAVDRVPRPRQQGLFLAQLRRHRPQVARPEDGRFLRRAADAQPPGQQREASGRDAVAGAVRGRDAIGSGGRLCLRRGAG